MSNEQKYDVVIFFKSGNHMPLLDLPENVAMHLREGGEIIAGNSPLDDNFIKNGGFSFSVSGNIESKEYFNPNNIELIKVFKHTEYYLEAMRKRVTN